MKAVAGRWSSVRSLLLMAVVAWLSLPALAQENSPDVTTMPVGTLFRWLNFLLVFGILAYLVAKSGAPYFRARAQTISNSIEEAHRVLASAERELREAEGKLAAVPSEIEQERRSAERDSAADRERIRNLTNSEIEKIGQAARAEIAAAERAGTQELRAIAARLATERAAALIRKQMNEAAEAALFDSFVEELAKAAS